MDAPTLPIDLLGRDLYCGDPNPVYAWLRAEAPVYRDEANALWGISRYRDVVDIETQPDQWTNSRGFRPGGFPTPSMLGRDDPRHLAQRRLVNRTFTPRAVARHEEQVRRAVGELIDRVAETGRCDIVADLAAPLPVIMILERLGLDRSLWPRAQHWVEVMMDAGGGARYRRDEMDQVMAEYADEVLAVAARRRVEPADDLISRWVVAEIDDEPLADDNLVADATLVLNGGADTTRTVIGTGVRTLLEHDDQRELLCRDPTVLATTGADELIRWVTPVLNMCRHAVADVELHGVPIAAGDQVLLMYSSANVDETVFADPLRFDLTRDPNPHLAFGFGTHFCLGAALARLEVRVVFEELARRLLPSLRLAEGFTPEFVTNAFVRGFDELHVEFDPVAALASA